MTGTKVIKERFSCADLLRHLPRTLFVAFLLCQNGLTFGQLLNAGIIGEEVSHDTLDHYGEYHIPIPGDGMWWLCGGPVGMDSLYYTVSEVDKHYESHGQMLTQISPHTLLGVCQSIYTGPPGYFKVDKRDSAKLPVSVRVGKDEDAAEKYELEPTKCWTKNTQYPSFLYVTTLSTSQVQIWVTEGDNNVVLMTVDPVTDYKADSATYIEIIFPSEVRVCATDKAATVGITLSDEWASTE